MFILILNVHQFLFMQMLMVKNYLAFSVMLKQVLLQNLEQAGLHHGPQVDHDRHQSPHDQGHRNADGPHGQSRLSVAVDHLHGQSLQNVGLHGQSLLNVVVVQDADHLNVVKKILNLIY